MVSDFEDLVIYQQSRELAKQVYTVTRQGEFKHDFRFVQQIRAAVGSISDNMLRDLNVKDEKNFYNFFILQKVHAENFDRK